MSHQLTTIFLPDQPESWSDGGFSVVEDCTRIANTMVALDSSDDGRGIVAISIDGLEGELDGIELRPSVDLTEVGEHDNGVSGFDHLVVMTPDCDRTTAALEAVGIESRRVRQFETSDGPRRQTFFWLGDVILELVGPDEATGDGPAIAWGLALTCADLDGAAARLGPKLGRVKDAVQPGRRITTMRTRDLGITTAIALMSPHPG